MLHTAEDIATTQEATRSRRLRHLVCKENEIIVKVSQHVELLFTYNFSFPLSFFIGRWNNRRQVLNKEGKGTSLW